MDTSVFYPKTEAEIANTAEKYGIDLGKKIILGVSSIWKADKGVQIFLNLAQAVSADYRIILVGVSPCQKECIPSSVLAIERTENMQELAILYSMADVLLNASKEETFGMVPAEAMACGTPVVVSSGTACPEIVNSGVGFVVSIDSVEELKGAIEEICTRGKDRYRQNCVSMVRNMYSLEEMNRQYYDLYRCLMKEE